jgi:twitching motility protein PilT
VLDYTLTDLMNVLIDSGGSDLHIKAGEPPVIRVHGDLVRLEQYPRLTPEDTKELMYSILAPDQRATFETELELDTAFQIRGRGRFRVNVMQQQFCVGGVMRLIPEVMQTIDDLGLPQVLKEISLLPRGLVLVTGPTGSGKSTTLAACINHINGLRRSHIITIEDPIEFVHADKLSSIEQRQLGQDTLSFAEALKHVLRQAPDVILVGEMRDPETISLAITAAETGHLVFATLHTNDAAQTIDRMVDVFSVEQQEQIRTQLATTLMGIVAQQLLPLKHGKGRIAAFEIMRVTPAIRALIREAKTEQMYTIIESGGDLGMVSLDAYLLRLLAEDKVEYEEALAKTSNLVDFEQRAARDGLKPSAAGVIGDAKV